jgi:hypothetical protein
MSRVLAALVAVAMVVGAFYVRDRIEAREEDDDRDAEQTEGNQGEPAGAQRLVCATEVAAACRRLAEGAGEDLQVDAAPAGDMLQRLSTARDVDEADLDLWLVPAPWPEMVGILRDPGLPGLLTTQTDVSPVIARSPLVLVGFDERLAALAPECEGTVTWRCIGERAGQPWNELGLQAPGTLRPGHLDPTSSATGLLVLGQAVTSFFGRSDVSLADLQSDGFSTWFRRLERAVPGFDPTSGSQLTEMLTRGVASYDVIGTTEAEAAPRLASAAGGRQSLEVLGAEPAASADLVLVALPGSGGLERALSRFGDALGDALGEDGWRVEGGPVHPALADGPPLPQDSGLPDAGLLVALQQRWEEVAR